MKFSIKGRRPYFPGCSSKSFHFENFIIAIEYLFISATWVLLYSTDLSNRTIYGWYTIRLSSSENFCWFVQICPVEIHFRCRINLCDCDCILLDLWVLSSYDGMILLKKFLHSSSLISYSFRPLSFGKFHLANNRILLQFYGSSKFHKAFCNLANSLYENNLSRELSSGR